MQCLSRLNFGVGNNGIQVLQDWLESGKLTGADVYSPVIEASKLNNEDRFR
jgi:hypothetical protein